MANPQKGEIELEIGGKSYTYLLGTYGLAKLEQRMHKPWPQVIQEAQQNGWGFDIVLAFFHCGLLLHHEPLSEKDASVLLDQLTVPRFMEVLRDMWTLQFGEAKADPMTPAIPRVANGSGMPSSTIG